MNTAYKWFDAIELPKNKTQLELYLKHLLAEELEELTSATNVKDMIDAIGDIDFVHKGISYIVRDMPKADTTEFIKYNGTYYTATVIIDDFRQHHPVEYELLKQAIAYSNFSKFCKTEQEAIESMNAYHLQGIPISYKLVDDSYVLRVKETVAIGTKLYPEGKVMKSINFRAPNLDRIITMLEAA